MNFDSEDFSQSKTFSILEKQGGSGKIILDAISLSLFGKTFLRKEKLRKFHSSLTRPVLPPLNLALLAAA